MSENHNHLRSLLGKKEINQAIDRLTTLLYSVGPRDQSPYRKSPSRTPRKSVLQLTPELKTGRDQALNDITNIIDDYSDRESNTYTCADKEPKSPLETVRRLYIMEKKKEIKIKELKLKKLQEESKQLSFTPEINQTSRLLADKLGERAKPFHLRSGDYVSRRNAELEQLRRTCEEEKKAKQHLETEWNSKYCSSNSSSTTRGMKPCSVAKKRKPDEFVEDMSNWLKKKKESLIERHVEKLERENDGLTFQPEINRKSLVIANKKKADGPVEERLLKVHQQKLAKEKQEQQNPNRGETHSPMISKRSLVLAERYRSKRSGTDSNSTVSSQLASTRSITPLSKRGPDSNAIRQECFGDLKNKIGRGGDAVQPKMAAHSRSHSCWEVSFTLDEATVLEQEEQEDPDEINSQEKPNQETFIERMRRQNHRGALEIRSKVKK